MFASNLIALSLILFVVIEIYGVHGSTTRSFMCQDHSSDYFYSESRSPSPALFVNVSLNQGASYTFQCKRRSSVNGASFKSCLMEELPKNLFDSFQALKNVDFSFCQMKHISRYSLDNAKTLLTLNLSRNSLEQLGNFSFEGAKTLATLDVSNNLINQIGDKAFLSLRALESLYLQGNRLKTLDSSVFQDLTSLKIIFLHNNELEEVPKGLFANNGQIRDIFLHNNRIRRVDERAFMVASGSAPIALEVLALSNNFLTALILRSIRVESVLVSNNKLEQILISSAMIKVVAVNNVITKILVDNNTAAVTIQELNLRNNSLTSLSPIDSFEYLKTLDLSYNHLGPLSVASFAKLPGLTALKLQQTNISNLQHGTFAKQQQLQVLDISYNNLGKIDFDIFISARDLTLLYLDGNRLTSIDFNQAKKIFPKLKAIGLNDNYWNCSFLTKIVWLCKIDNIDLRPAAPSDVTHNQTNVAGISCYDRTEPLRDWNVTTQHIGQQIRASNGSDTAALQALLQNVLDDVKQVDERHLSAAEKQTKLEETVSGLIDQQFALSRDIIGLRGSLVDISLSLLSDRSNNFSASNEDDDVRRMIESVNNLTQSRLKLTEERLSDIYYKLMMLGKQVEQWSSSGGNDWQLHSAAYRQRQQFDQQTVTNEGGSNGGSNVLTVVILVTNCLLVGVLIFVLLRGSRKSYSLGTRMNQRTRDSRSTIVEQEI